MRCCRRFLDERGILLSHRIHLRDRLTQLLDVALYPFEAAAIWFMMSRTFDAACRTSDIVRCIRQHRQCEL